MDAIIEHVSDYELEPHRRTGGKPMLTLNHSIIQGNLTFALKLNYRDHYSFLPEINLTMPARPDTVPDIAIYPKLQIDFLPDVTSMVEMPLTVIEIVSPSQSNDDILAKFERYFQAGVQSCWLVLPSLKAIAVYSEFGKYRFFSEHDTLTDSVTGIDLALNEVYV